LFIFNILGVVMICVAVGIGFCVRFINGAEAEGPETILVGALCILFDVTYRVQQSNGHWISPFGGGNLFFVPVWGIGAIWMVVGTVKCFTNPAPIGILGIAIVSVLVVAAFGLALLQIICSERPNFSKFIAGLSAKEGGGSSSSSPRIKSKNIRCPECDLPCKSAELRDGKCPWCGASVEESLHENR
jgi:hypothetical protein